MGLANKYRLSLLLAFKRYLRNEYSIILIQDQLPTGVLENRCSETFGKFPRKYLLVECNFWKVTKTDRLVFSTLSNFSKTLYLRCLADFWYVFEGIQSTPVFWKFPKDSRTTSFRKTFGRTAPFVTEFQHLLQLKFAKIDLS